MEQEKKQRFKRQIFEWVRFFVCAVLIISLTVASWLSCMLCIQKLTQKTTDTDTATTMKTMTTTSTASTDSFDDLEGTEIGGGVIINAKETVCRTFITLELGSMPLGFPSCTLAGDKLHDTLKQAGVEFASSKRSEWTFTLLIGFPEVRVPNGKYKGQTVLTTCSAKLEMPARSALQPDNVKILIEPDPIYVFDSWYKLFTGYGNDMTQMTVSIWTKGYAVPLFAHNGNSSKPIVKNENVKNGNTTLTNKRIWIEQKEVPITVDDPESEEYIPGGGGGTTDNPDWVKDIDLLLSGCGSTEEIAFVIVIIIGLIALGIVLKVVKFIFG